MNKARIIRDSLTEAFNLVEGRDGLCVTTQCLYPSNEYVRVVVRGGAETFYVSDEGGSLREVESAGATVPNPKKLLGNIITPLGLSITDGVIRSPKCQASTLAFAISLVANASKDCAELLFSHLKLRPNDSFKEIVSSFLRKNYRDSVRAETIVGHSNKSHKFDNIIYLSNNRKIVVDPVINDRSSINSRVVANIDLREADYPDLQQRIVYDDSEKWLPEDLNLLQVGAPVIGYSRAKEVLSRLAANG